MKLAVMAMAMVESWDEYPINQPGYIADFLFWVGLQKKNSKSQSMYNLFGEICINC